MIVFGVMSQPADFVISSAVSVRISLNLPATLQESYVMPRRLWVLCLAFAVAGLAMPARADLVISIGSASVAQGGTGTVDVFLTSTASSGIPDLINNYGFQLQITNNGADNT
jgi:hypothetical protein